MKIRQGFVSNSSSCSFICKICKSEYDVESRGGSPDGWKSPKAGLCEGCEKSHFVCKCGKYLNNSGGKYIERGYDVSAICEGGSYEDYRLDGNGEITKNPEIINLDGKAWWSGWSHYVCPECFVTHNEFKEEFEKWSKMITDPDYRPTIFDKEAITHSQRR